MRRPRIETFDLNLIRIFDALFQHGSVNAAASEIGVSASAVSHALARLRQVFEDELFVKGPGGMVPTARATELSGSVTSALGHVRSILEPWEFKPEMTGRHFKIRCNHYVSWLMMPDIMAYLREQSPGVNLTVQCDDSKGIADELDTGVVDLILGNFRHVPNRFESELLLYDHFVWVLREDHPAIQDDITPEKLGELPQLIVASNELGRSIDGVLVEAGLERYVINDKMYLVETKNKSRYNMDIKAPMVINSVLSAPAILAKTDLAALLPVRLAEVMAQRYPLAMFPSERGNRIEHRMVWHGKHAKDPAINWLCSMVKAAITHHHVSPAPAMGDDGTSVEEDTVFKAVEPSPTL